MSDTFATRLSSRRLSLRGQSTQPMVDPRLLRPATLGVYGDEFDQKTLDGKWASSGTLGSALAIAGNSWATVNFNSVAYVYAPAPAGDFVVTACMQHVDGVATNLTSLLVLDSSGNGVGIGPYNSPDWLGLFSNVTAGAYGGTAFQTGTDTGQRAQVYGAPALYRINKVGTTYTGQMGSLDGTTWTAAGTSITGPSTATRVGVGRIQSLAGASTTRIDWIAVTQ